jgi:hypothetical protein
VAKSFEQPIFPSNMFCTMNSHSFFKKNNIEHVNVNPSYFANRVESGIPYTFVVSLLHILYHTF